MVIVVRRLYWNLPCHISEKADGCMVLISVHPVVGRISYIAEDM